jgi:hypothetical protein
MSFGSAHPTASALGPGATPALLSALDALPLEWVGVHTDVTEQRRAEREREALIQALEVSNRELDQFAYGAESVDLKAPLGGISNLSTFVEEDLGDAVTPEVGSHCALTRASATRRWWCSPPRTESVTRWTPTSSTWRATCSSP